MRRKTIKRNIRRTLFFSSSIILSTLFFAIYLVTKNECQSILNNQKDIEKELNYCQNTLKSLERKKTQLIQSIGKTAFENYNLVTPDPESITISMDENK